jgi:lipopolysaccharide export system permease protein
MTVSNDKKFLEFHLRNGHRYEEKGNVNSSQNEFIALGFKEYNKLFDLTQLNLQKTSDSLFMNNIRMKTLRQLDNAIDSLKKIPDSLVKRNKADLKTYIRYAKYEDSIENKKIKSNVIREQGSKKNKKINSFDELVPDSLQRLVRDQALATIGNVRNMLEITGTDHVSRLQEITYNKIEWHKKLSLSFACLVLFFIGAPLGSIIRKGGLGMPLVVALIFFMIFYLLNIFGEKFTKDNVFDPVTGVWLPVIVLTPVGIFLTYKAMHDSQLFNKEYYYRLFKKLGWGTEKLYGFFRGT